MRDTGLRGRAPWACGLLATIALACGSEQATPQNEASAPPANSTGSVSVAATPAPAAVGPGDAAAGAKSYATFCASCHGEGGCGDGPLAQTLDPKPARHCDGDIMNVMEDSDLVEVITRGGPAMGKSPLMASWGGTLSPQQIRDVVAFIRTLADPPYAPPTS